jgi:hypothetical protein
MALACLWLAEGCEVDAVEGSAFANSWRRCYIVIVENPFKPHAEGVPKTVIGRKLEALMGKRPGAAGVPSLPPSADQPSGSGMRSLFRGHPASSTQKRPARIPRWYLFGADLALVTTALLVMCKSPAPLTGNEKFFGAAAVVLGAILALIGMCMGDPKDL